MWQYEMNIRACAIVCSRLMWAPFVGFDMLPAGVLVSEGDSLYRLCAKFGFGLIFGIVILFYPCAGERAKSAE